jgi:hypothetical protein
MKTLEEELEKEMNKGVDHNDPFWELFKCKDMVNFSIVEAYKMGFTVGFKRMEEQNEELRERLKEAEEVIKAINQEELSSMTGVRGERYSASCMMSYSYIKKHKQDKL